MLHKDIINVINNLSATQKQVMNSYVNANTSTSYIEAYADNMYYKISSSLDGNKVSFRNIMSPKGFLSIPLEPNASFEQAMDLVHFILEQKDSFDNYIQDVNHLRMMSLSKEVDDFVKENMDIIEIAPFLRLIHSQVFLSQNPDVGNDAIRKHMNSEDYDKVILLMKTSRDVQQLNLTDEDAKNKLSKSFKNKMNQYEF